MSYDYVRKAYSVNPIVWQRATFISDNRNGVICRADKWFEQYVMVKFDGQKFSVPCHPTDLHYHSKAVKP